MRYPIVEAITAVMYVGYYLAFFYFQAGPCIPGAAHELTSRKEGWVYGLDIALLSGLLAASLIDAELFIIPIEIPWLLAIVGVVVHSIFDSPDVAGSVMAERIPAAMGLGGVIGLAISFALLARGVLKRSFADGAPMLEVEREENARRAAEKKPAKSKNDDPTPKDAEPREWNRAQVRREMGKEMAFLIAPLFLAALFAFLAWKVEPVARIWERVAAERWVSAALGSILGGLVGGFVVWLTRILGSLVFGREAMGMGDVDLMLGVGAVLGAGAATLTFFLAPFFGIALALYMLFTGKKRELPYGPYLSLAAAFVILFYCPMAAYFTPGLQGLLAILRGE